MINDKEFNNGRMNSTFKKWLKEKVF